MMRYLELAPAPPILWTSSRPSSGTLSDLSPFDEACGDVCDKVPVNRGTLAPLAYLLLLLLGLAPAPKAAESASPQLTLPLDYQVFQRRTATEGIIMIAANWANDGAIVDTVEARLLGAGRAESWRKLANLDSGQKTFRSELSAPAGGWSAR